MLAFLKNDFTFFVKIGFFKDGNIDGSFMAKSRSPSKRRRVFYESLFIW